MNSIYPNISSISASLHHKRIYITLSHMAILLCLPRYSSGMCIPQWLHRERGSGPSFRILILAFQCRLMRFSLNLTELCALARHPSTRHANDFNTSGKDTTYVSSPLPPMSTPPGIWHEYFVGLLHAVADQQFCHCHPAIPENHLVFIPLNECALLPRLTPLICRYPQLHPYEPQGTHHCLSLTEVIAWCIRSYCVQDCS